MAITAMNMVKQGGSDPHSTMTLNEEQEELRGSTRGREGPAEKALLRTRILNFIQIGIPHVLQF